MSKTEMDILDPLDNSSDGGEEILGMVEESSYAGSGPAKGLPETGGGDLPYPEYYKDQCGSGVAYRLVMSSDEATSNSSLPTQQTFSPGALASNGQSPQGIPAVLANSVNGQLYVIGNTELFNAPNTKQSVSRDTHAKVTNIIKKRDDRRRATHNEVERRRRDKINSWIVKLAKLMPRNDAVDKMGMESKGGILAKACDYISELKDNEERVELLEKSNLKLSSDLDTLMVQYKALRKANTQMRNLLKSRGIHFEADPSAEALS